MAAKRNGVCFPPGWLQEAQEEGVILVVMQIVELLRKVIGSSRTGD
jgi:hypothetical protein